MLQHLKRALGSLTLSAAALALVAGTASNIIPDSAELSGTIRTYDPATEALIVAKLDAIYDFGLEMIFGEMLKSAKKPARKA